MPPDEEDQVSSIGAGGTALALRTGTEPALSGDATENLGEERTRLLCEATVDIAAALFSISAEALRSNGRAPRRVTRVRQIAMYAAHTVLGLSQREVGIAFHRDRTTVVHACHTVEDLRDDKAFDQDVLLFETILMAAFRAQVEAPWR